jgi:hypothetical protein
MPSKTLHETLGRGCHGDKALVRLRVTWKRYHKVQVKPASPRYVVRTLEVAPTSRDQKELGPLHNLDALVEATSPWGEWPRSRAK